MKNNSKLNIFFEFNCFLPFYQLFNNNLLLSKTENQIKFLIKEISFVILLLSTMFTECSIVKCATGDCATGDCPTGDCPTGDCPTGDCPTGDCFTGNCFTGNCATGDCNFLDWFGLTYEENKFAKWLCADDLYGDIEDFLLTNAITFLDNYDDFYRFSHIVKASFNVYLREFSLIAEFYLALTALITIIYCSLIIYSKIYKKRNLIQFSGTSISILILFFTLALISKNELIFTKYLSIDFSFLNDSLGNFAKIITIMLSLVCIYLTKNSLTRNRINCMEYDLLILYAILGLLLVTTANDLLTIFLTLELQGLSIYILVGIKRNSMYSIDGGLKYIFVASLSTAYYLLGSGLLFGISGLLVLSKLHYIINEVDLGDEYFSINFEELEEATFVCCSKTNDLVYNFPFIYCNGKKELYINTLNFCQCEGKPENNTDSSTKLPEFGRWGNWGSSSNMREIRSLYFSRKLFEIIEALRNASKAEQKRLIEKLIEHMKLFSDRYGGNHSQFNSFELELHKFIKQLVNSKVQAERESIIQQIKELIENFCEIDMKLAKEEDAKDARMCKRLEKMLERPELRKENQTKIESSKDTNTKFVNPNNDTQTIIDECNEILKKTNSLPSTKKSLTLLETKILKIIETFCNASEAEQKVLISLLKELGKKFFELSEILYPECKKCIPFCESMFMESINRLKNTVNLQEIAAILKKMKYYLYGCLPRFGQDCGHLSPSFFKDIIESSKDTNTKFVNFNNDTQTIIDECNEILKKTNSLPSTKKSLTLLETKILKIIETFCNASEAEQKVLISLLKELGKKFFELSEILYPECKECIPFCKSMFMESIDQLKNTVNLQEIAAVLKEMSHYLYGCSPRFGRICGHLSPSFFKDIFESSKWRKKPEFKFEKENQTKIEPSKDTNTEFVNPNNDTQTIIDECNEILKKTNSLPSTKKSLTLLETKILKIIETFCNASEAEQKVLISLLKELGKKFFELSEILYPECKECIPFCEEFFKNCIDRLKNTVNLQEIAAILKEMSHYLYGCSPRFGRNCGRLDPSFFKDIFESSKWKKPKFKFERENQTKIEPSKDTNTEFVNPNNDTQTIIDECNEILKKTNSLPRTKGGLTLLETKILKIIETFCNASKAEQQVLIGLLEELGKKFFELSKILYPECKIYILFCEYIFMESIDLLKHTINLQEIAVILKEMKYYLYGCLPRFGQDCGHLDPSFFEDFNESSKDTNTEFVNPNNDTQTIIDECNEILKKANSLPSTTKSLTLLETKILKIIETFCNASKAEQQVLIGLLEELGKKFFELSKILYPECKIYILFCEYIFMESIDLLKHTINLQEIAVILKEMKYYLYGCLPRFGQDCGHLDPSFFEDFNESSKDTNTEFVNPNNDTQTIIDECNEILKKANSLPSTTKSLTLLETKILKIIETFCNASKAEQQVLIGLLEELGKKFFELSKILYPECKVCVLFCEEFFKSCIDRLKHTINLQEIAAILNEMIYYLYGCLPRFKQDCGRLDPPFFEDFNESSKDTNTEFVNPNNDTQTIIDECNEILKKANSLPSTTKSLTLLETKILKIIETFCNASKAEQQVLIGLLEELGKKFFELSKILYPECKVCVLFCEEFFKSCIDRLKHTINLQEIAAILNEMIYYLYGCLPRFKQDCGRLDPPFFEDFNKSSKDTNTKFVNPNNDTQTIIDECNEILKKANSLPSTEESLTLLETKILKIIETFCNASEAEQQVLICLLEELGKKFFELSKILYPECKECIPFCEYIFMESIDLLKHTINLQEIAAILKEMKYYLYGCLPRVGQDCGHLDPSFLKNIIESSKDTNTEFVNPNNDTQTIIDECNEILKKANSLPSTTKSLTLLETKILKIIEIFCNASEAEQQVLIGLLEELGKKFFELSKILYPECKECIPFCEEFFKNCIDRLKNTVNLQEIAAILKEMSHYLYGCSPRFGRNCGRLDPSFFKDFNESSKWKKPKFKFERENQTKIEPSKDTNTEFVNPNNDTQTIIDECNEILKKANSLPSTEESLTLLETKILKIIETFCNASEAEQQVLICLLEELGKKFFELSKILYPECKECIPFCEYIFMESIDLLKHTINLQEIAAILKEMKYYLYGCLPRVGQDCGHLDPSFLKNIIESSKDTNTEFVNPNNNTQTIIDECNEILKKTNSLPSTTKSLTLLETKILKIIEIFCNASEAEQQVLIGLLEELGKKFFELSEILYPECKECIPFCEEFFKNCIDRLKNTVNLQEIASILKEMSHYLYGCSPRFGRNCGRLDPSFFKDFNESSKWKKPKFKFERENQTKIEPSKDTNTEFVNPNNDTQTIIDECNEILKKANSLPSTEESLTLLETKILKIIETFCNASEAEQQVLICLLEELGKKFFELSKILYPECKECIPFCEYIFMESIDLLKHTINLQEIAAILKEMKYYLYGCLPRVGQDCGHLDPSFLKNIIESSKDTNTEFVNPNNDTQTIIDECNEILKKTNSLPRTKGGLTLLETKILKIIETFCNASKAEQQVLIGLLEELGKKFFELSKILYPECKECIPLCEEFFKNCIDRLKNTVNLQEIAAILKEMSHYLYGCLPLPRFGQGCGRLDPSFFIESSKDTNTKFVNFNNDTQTIIDECNEILKKTNSLPSTKGSLTLLETKILKIIETLCNASKAEQQVLIGLLEELGKKFFELSEILYPECKECIPLCEEFFKNCIDRLKNTVNLQEIAAILKEMSHYLYGCSPRFGQDCGRLDPFFFIDYIESSKWRKKPKFKIKPDSSKPNGDSTSVVIFEDIYEEFTIEEFIDILLNENNFFTLLSFSLNFILVSFFFKLSGAPFHLWSLDIYEESPTSSTIFFAVVTKFSIIVILAKICYCGFYDVLKRVLYQYFIFVSTLSVFVGAVAGLREQKLKSLLAYSSINNIGYLLLTLTIGTVNSIKATFFYLIIYISSSLATWSGLMSIQIKKNRYIKKQNKDFADLVLIRKSNPMLTIILHVALFSTAGLPPFIGFLTKMSVFLVSVESHMFLISLITILLSMISSFYYLRLVKITCFEKVLIGKLHQTIKFNQSNVNNILAFFLFYLFLKPGIAIFFSYKIIIC